MRAPLPEAIGPYRILRALGEGGMGVVYEVTRGARGRRRYALKTVRVPDAGLLHGIRREIHALSRLRHPGIVRIVDSGTHAGLPWYAMEMVVAPTLSRHAREAASGVPRLAEPVAAGTDDEGLRWTERLEPGRCLEPASTPAPAPTGARSRAGFGRLHHFLTLVRRLCAPLAYLHGEGFVHRDLKPGNVLVRDDGMPVLVDFGLAASFSAGLSRESIDVAGESVGTVAYLAPEQAKGELVDARADLYALGGILYELLTGRPPFVEGTALDVLTARLQRDPAPPSELADGVPEELDRLVMAMLRREPRERLGYAEDVAAALARLGAEDGLAASGPRPRPYLYRPGFSGRQELLEGLQSRLYDVFEGSGGIVLLSGESGSGKTRLAMALAEHAVLQRVDVLVGGCVPAQPGQPVEGGSSLHAFREPLLHVADRCRERGAEATERLLGRRRALLARYEPALATLPGEPLVEPAELPAEAARLRLFSFVTATLAALAEDRPVLLLLDDLQWADELSLGLLEYLARGSHLAKVPLIVLGTFRSEEVSGGLRKLLEAPGVALSSLPSLPETAVAEMVREMLAMAEPSPPFVAFLARQSEGNPFFVGEYLRTAVAEGVLARDDGAWRLPAVVEASGRYETLPIPGSVVDLVMRRLQPLPRESRHVLGAAAVLGREMRFDLLAAGAGLGDVELYAALDPLESRQVMEELPGGRLRFAHDKFREVAYAALTDAERVRHHRGAADAIEARPAERQARLGELGHHHEQCGEPDRARACYLPAARAALARHAYAEAERLFRSYLALVTVPTEESIEARNDLGRRVLQILGRLPEAEAEHARAEAEAALLPSPKLASYSLHQRGLVAYLSGRTAEALAILGRTLTAARDLGERALEGSVLVDVANLHHVEGRAGEARAVLEQALGILREVGHRSNEGVALANLAVLAYVRGELPEARRRMEEAIAIHHELGDRRAEGVVLGNLASVLAAEGERDRALGLYERALAIARDVGDIRNEGLWLSNLASLCVTQGRVGEAEGLFSQALHVHRASRNAKSESLVLQNLAYIAHLERDGLDRAEALAHEALAIAERVGSRVEAIAALQTLGTVALARGGDAGAFLARARELASGADIPAASLSESLGKLERAVAAAAEGKALVLGECMEDVPPGLLEWLRQHRSELCGGF